MTNDRRKTFNTPLEFWQWAIMEPGKRKATGAGLVITIGERFGKYVCLDHKEGIHPNANLIGYTFTAVEDEHGVIEDERLTTAEEFIESNTGSLNLAMLKRLIDERIAAATVVLRDLDGVSEWKGGFAPACYRLKPKEE